MLYAVDCCRIPDSRIFSVFLQSTTVSSVFVARKSIDGNISLSWRVMRGIILTGPVKLLPATVRRPRWITFCCRPAGSWMPDGFEGLQLFSPFLQGLEIQEQKMKLKIYRQLSWTLWSKAGPAAIPYGGASRRGALGFARQLYPWESLFVSLPRPQRQLTCLAISRVFFHCSALEVKCPIWRCCYPVASCSRGITTLLMLILFVSAMCGGTSEYAAVSPVKTDPLWLVFKCEHLVRYLRMEISN